MTDNINEASSDEVAESSADSQAAAEVREVAASAGADGTESTGQALASEQSDDSGNDDEPAAPGSLEAELDVAFEYLDELFAIADLDGEFDTYTENGRAQMSIVTDSQVLVGKDGEVLEALQELVRLAVMAETDHRTRLMLDVAGYREKRRTTLRGLATDAVQEVKESGESVRLSPMNPFERKIVHDAVAEAGLRSESEGKEPQRRVVVLPAE